MIPRTPHSTTSQLLIVHTTLLPSALSSPSHAVKRHKKTLCNALLYHFKFVPISTQPHPASSSRPRSVSAHTILLWRVRRLTGTALEGLSEEEKLDLVVDGQHTGTGDTTENVGTSTLEERLDTLSGDDLATGIKGRLVLDGLCVD